MGIHVARCRDHLIDLRVTSIVFRRERTSLELGWLGQRHRRPVRATLVVPVNRKRYFNGTTPRCLISERLHVATRRSATKHSGVPCVLEIALLGQPTPLL
jgi:hypothetical protein